MNVQEKTGTSEERFMLRQIKSYHVLN
jgi:hypothetical protein